MRIFIGIPVSEHMKKNLSIKQNELKLKMIKGHLTDLDNLHLTLLFIGEMSTDDIEKLNMILIKALKHEKSFEIGLKEMGYFSKKNHHIAWAGINEGFEELNRLSRIINEAANQMNLHFDQKSFSPHITLAKEAVFKSMIEPFIEPSLLKVDVVYMYLSHRENNKLVYTPIKSYPLH